MGELHLIALQFDVFFLKVREVHKYRNLLFRCAVIFIDFVGMQIEHLQFLGMEFGSSICIF